MGVSERRFKCGGKFLIPPVPLVGSAWSMGWRASKLVPGIAESWSVSPEGTTFTFKIRRGLKFPSGNPVTAVDVLWSMKRTLTLNLANAQRLREWDITSSNVDSVIKVVDPFTLVITPVSSVACSITGVFW